MKPTVLVTGASRGIGKAIAYEFARNGYNVVINYLNSNYFSIYDTEKEINTGNVEKKYNRIRDSKDFENKKLIALTFDDGPAYTKTDKLLELLSLC